MSRKTYVEVVCEGCGSACHYSPGNINQQLRDAEWYRISPGKEYCSKECFEEARKRDLVL